VLRPRLPLQNCAVAKLGGHIQLIAVTTDEKADRTPGGHILQPAAQLVVLEPVDQPIVHYEWIKMPDSSGFGSYTESGLVIPARLNGEEVNFVSQMYLDDDPPIAAGREIWGFPKKYAHPKLEIVKDTLTGTLEYAGQLVAMGTMGYKHESMAGNGERTTATLTKTQVNLKLIPGVDGALALAQLNACNLADLEAQGAWSGAAGFNGVHPANAPVADLLARHVPAGLHFIANLTLPCDRVVFDYLAP